MALSPTTTAALIQGGTALLGGMFKDKGPSLKKQHRLGRESQQKLARDLPQYIVAGAQKAGFNPLTMLRATGGSVGSPTQANISPLGQRSAIGDAIAQFGATYAQDAIQRETEQRQNEEWTRRYDYDLANRPVSPVSPTAATDPQNAISKRDDFVGVVPNIFGSSSEDFQIPPDSDSPYAGRYVIRVKEDNLLMPEGWVPVDGVSGALGEIAGEVHGAQTFLDMGEKVRLLKDGTVLKMPNQPKAPLNTGGPANRAGGTGGPLKIDIPNIIYN